MKLVTWMISAPARARLEALVPPILWRAAYRALIVKRIPNHYAYNPHYSPWLEPEFVARADALRRNTGIKPQGLYTLLHFLEDSLSLEGDVVECGVWRGGSAKLMRDTLIERGVRKHLYLFDSFEGMAKVDAAHDRHDAGDYQDTSLEYVQSFVTGSRQGAEDPQSIAIFRKGWIPQSFAGLDDLKVCFAHIDLDLYQSIHDALEFIYRRLTKWGAIVFDDYGFASCPGARGAVDEFFADKPERPFCLSNGQAVIIKR